MSSSGILRLTFFLSIFVHGMILFCSSDFNFFSVTPKKKEIEVRYIKKSPQITSSSNVISGTNRPSFPSRQMPLYSPGTRVTSGSRIPPPYLEQNKTASVLKNKPLAAPKPTFAGSELIAIKRKVALPPIEMAKIDNPSYINYYQIVREKIRRSAYQNYSRNETGEAYISFIISYDGYIKDVRLVEDRTTANDYLKDIALKSVKSASPFPNFPKELDYPQLSFNIIISFEIE